MNFSEETGDRQNIRLRSFHYPTGGRTNRFVQDERWYKKNGRWETATGQPVRFPKTANSALANRTTSKHLNQISGVNRKHDSKYYMLLGNYSPYMVTLTADRPEGFMPRRKSSTHGLFLSLFPAPDRWNARLPFHQSPEQPGFFCPFKRCAYRSEDEAPFRQS